MRRAATKITSALGDIRGAMKCDHDLTFVKWTDTGAQVKTCSKCKCRFTSWMGSEHWDATIQKPTSQDRLMEPTLSEIAKSLADLHAKIDRLSSRSECKLRHNDGGNYGHSYSTCDVHPSGTPWCMLNSTTVTR